MKVSTGHAKERLGGRKLINNYSLLRQVHLDLSEVKCVRTKYECQFISN